MPSVATIELSRPDTTTKIVVCKKHAQTVKRLSHRLGTKPWVEKTATPGQTCLYCASESGT